MITVVDKNSGWFGIDNQFVDEIMKNLNPISSCIYIVLKRFASNKTSCFPSQDTIAKRMGVSRQTVNKYVKELVDKKIISIEEEITKKGKMFIYTLLPMSMMLTRGCQQDRQGVVNTVDTNKTYINKKNISKDISYDSQFFKDEIKRVEKKKDNRSKEITITILDYMLYKEMEYPTNKAYLNDYKRHMKPASIIIDYPEKDYQATAKYFDNKNISWTLETIAKHIANKEYKLK